jgi:surface-anchored protein
MNYRPTLMKMSFCGLRPLGLALVMATTISLKAQTLLESGHADLGVLYQQNAWDLHVHHEDLGEFDPGEVILQVGPAAESTVPAHPGFSFLGSAGTSVWILPQTEEGHSDHLLFLGLSAEEQEPGLFLNDRITLSLAGVTGPGQFALYEVDAFGTPSVFMNSADGITDADRVDLLAGTHRHANWAFTMPGEYEVSFRASGTLADGLAFTQSDVVAYNFSVVPEPNAWSLLLLGGAVAWGWRWLKRQS